MVGDFSPHASATVEGVGDRVDRGGTPVFPGWRNVEEDYFQTPLRDEGPPFSSVPKRCRRPLVNGWGAVISQLARRGLRASAEAGSRSGMPVFSVTADAAIIPSNRARELLAEDLP